jgi:hypothetical protein
MAIAELEPTIAEPERPPLWGKLPLQVIIGSGHFGTGKAQPLDAKILTPNGWATMGDMTPGTEVIDPTGGTARVLAVFPQGMKEVFRVTFNDGSSTECCDDHLWKVQTANQRSTGSGWKVWPLSRIRKWLARDVKHEISRRLFIPFTEPVTFEPTGELSLDPYLVGVLIGDGCLTHGLHLANPEKEIRDRVANLLPSPVQMTETKHRPEVVRLSTPTRGGNDRDKNPLLIELRNLGLHGKRSTEKAIPEAYLRASKWDRLQLLNGLCDTDGYAALGSCEYSTSSPVLAKQVQELVWSLGGRASMSSRIPSYSHNGEKRSGAQAYRLYLRLPEGMNPFSVTRKRMRYRNNARTEPTRRITSIEPCGQKECQCILLDSNDHLYVTDDYIVTHNTLFGVTICPGPETLVFDNEGSSTIYEGIGFHRIDMAEQLTRKHPKGYSDEDRYLWWKEEAIRQGKMGKYRVLVTDPFSEIEAGIARHVERNPGKFGFTANQFKSSGGLFWGAVKAALKADLDQLRVLYETAYLTVHMRREFKGNTPTGRFEPKGKETLEELASLFLLFERKPDANGAVPAVPSATVIKSRLAHTRIGSDGQVEIVPILPPRLPQATPQAIRQYIQSPPNYNRLKKDERIVEEVLSDDEKLRLQAQIAESQREASEAELRKEELRQRALQAQLQAVAAAPPAPDQSAELAAKAEAKAAAEVADRITAEQMAAMRQLATDCFGSNLAAFGEWLQEQFDTARVKELTEDQAIEAMMSLSKLFAEQTTAKGAELMAGSDSVALPPKANAEAVAEPTPEAAPEPQAEAVASADPLVPPIRPDQDEKIRAILKENAACILPATFREMLARFGKTKIAELNSTEAAKITVELRDRVQRNQQEAEAAEPPAEASAPEGQEPENPEEPGTITRRQFDGISELVQQVGWPKDKRDAYLERLGIKSFRSLSYRQAQELAHKLGATLEKFQQQGIPKN